MNNNSGTPSPQKGSAGSWITILIVLLVLGFGAWYMWGRGNNDDTTNSVQAIGTQSSSDDAASIQADLNSTNVDNPNYNLDEGNFTGS